MTREEAIEVLHELDGKVYETQQVALDIAIKSLERKQYYKELAESYEKTINKLTKAIAEQEPKSEWIPVSERLPKESGNYMTYIVNPYNKNLQYPMICHYSAKLNSWFPDDENASDNVIAWQPLPKPYKESEGK